MLKIIRKDLKEALSEKVSRIAKEKGVFLVNEEREKNLDTSSWKLIVGISNFFTGVFSYMLGWNHGAENVLSRVPEPTSSIIRDDLKKETKRAIDDFCTD